LGDGEALLTSATGLRRVEPEKRREYLGELASVGVAALIVELGRGFKKLPAEMLEEARERGLVVAELQNEVPFVEVTQRVQPSSCASRIKRESSRPRSGTR
jgi:PucR family transcriptional regulator, purine catabolism regulatory protein